jgi:23S rRNA (uracil1939-C5)-methyltransferase
LDAQIGERLVDLKAMLSSLAGRETIPQLEMAVGDDGVAMIVRHCSPCRMLTPKSSWILPRH